VKYIILQTSTRLKGSKEPLVREYPILFPDELVHADVAEALQFCAGLKSAAPGVSKATVVAAGFFSSMDLNGISCFGKSESLGGIKSRAAQDDRLIKMLDYEHGVVL
jgi:hypothetical protein